MFASLFVVMLGLCYCSKESNQSFLGTPQLSGPSEALVKSTVLFKCELPTYPKNESILLQLFKKGTDTKLLGESISLNGEAAAFLLILTLSHEGNLECMARAQKNSNIEPTVSSTHYLKVVEPVQGAEIVVHSGVAEFSEGETPELMCNLTAGNHVLYTWLQNGRVISKSPVHIVSGNRLSIYRTTSENSSSYICEATNHCEKQIFQSRSSEVEIAVTDVLSAPDISFTVLKENSHNYFAVVTCHSTKGTPPFTFSLYNRSELVANMTSEDRSSTFKIPLVLGEHLGKLQCQAKNGNQTAHSLTLPLEVVLVGGPVTMHYDYDVGEDSAVVGLRFYCKAAKGSHPRYQWFLNEKRLHDRGSFYHVVDQPPEQSILLLAVGRSSAGTYHCEVSDSFDNTTAISSRKQYIDNEVLNRLPVSVVAVVFGCFTALIILVSICCWTGVLYRRRKYGEKSLLGLEMERRIAAYEGELDLSEYNEDAEVVQLAGGDGLDQGSEASVDEWPQIAEQKKTLEDEPVEGH
ncbi:Fc receptor-like protein 5 [Xiphias gladius]|uniref:Fc receptor-like protein 5 n=1 Tax=Xiphias gladius TaxID=8245 RepID=UPI001A99B93C|nr:Fc receptor-like protein 5 [Xiphias gladius]